MLNILLLGVVHEFQWQDPRFLYLPKPKAEIYLEQVRCYSQWVRAEIDSFHAQVIFDEMNLPECEPFNRLKDLRVVPWMYMDIPENVRALFQMIGNRIPGNEIIPAIDEPRERHWLRVVESISTECKLDTIAVLCGAAHLPTFGQKLHDTGHSVTAFDCRREHWYNPGYSNSQSPNPY
jgi:hypothetical protein